MTFTISNWLLIVMEVIATLAMIETANMHQGCSVHFRSLHLAMEFIIFVIFIISLGFYFCFINQKRKNVTEFPEPPGHFLLGHILEIGSTREILNVGITFTKKYGSIMKLRAGPYYKALLSTDYKLIEFMLSKTKGLKKSQNYEFLRPWLGNGLLISDGAEWKRARKILTPAFHFEILRKFVGVFESVGNVLVEKLQDYDGSESLDLCPLVSLCTLDVICETAMGTKINSQKGQNSEYVNSVKEMSHIVTDRGLSLLGLKNWSFVFTADYYRQIKLCKILHKFTFGVIAERKEASSDTARKSKKLALLDLLLNFRGEAGRMMSDDEIRQEVDTFMFEGHDTTATAICFTLFCIANHPHVQETVFKEQNDLFGKEKNPPVAYSDLQNMKYLENVIKESLRLYPPVPIIGKYATEDLHFNDYVIGKGTNLVLFLYGLHQNPEYFPEPEKFNPDRFNSMDGSLPYAYIPFSAGERNCIGQKFALLEMKSIVSKIIRHFELKPAIPKHELVLAAELVLKSLSGVNIGLKKRI